MADEAEAETPTAQMIFNVPISKFKGKTLAVDYGKIPDSMLALVVLEGLKPLINAKMSKLSPAKLEGEKLAEMQALVLEQAEKNLAALYAGTYTKGRPSATTGADGNKIPGPVVSEARRLARNDVKQAMKDANIKISHVPAKKITEAANELIQRDPKYYTLAEENLAKRAATPIAVDIKSLVQVSPELVAKAEAEKAARKSQLSAKQAGKVAPRKGTSPTGNSDPNSPKVNPAIAVPSRGQQGQTVHH